MADIRAQLTRVREAANDAAGSATDMIKDSTGKALPLNRASDKFRLNAGNTTLTLQAYVQGEPEAIQTKSIGRGTFSAVATFTLEYE